MAQKRETSTETLEQRSEKAKGERGRARHAAEAASERQATSQWKSIRERAAETRGKRNEERKFSDTAL